jgi:predicted GH43/DUF377 family glycosyl hydrolase
MKEPKAVVLILLLSLLVLLLTETAQAAEWIKDIRNPVLGPTPNGWDAGGVYLPRVIFSGTTFRMWYLGYGTSLQWPGKVGYAVSSDGVTWKKYHTPVLLPGPQRAWDSYSVNTGSVVWNGTHFVMWYRGLGPGFEFGAVGLATSLDGISWTKYAANPILTNRSFGVQVLDYPYVIRTESEYRMWCVGQPEGESPYAIYYATSGDGVRWNERAEPVLRPDINGWDGFGVYDPTVISHGSSYWMWYSSHPGIGYATSNDGISWKKSSENPILSRGPVGSWDHFSVGNQAALAFNGSVLLYYSAARALEPNEANSSIGLARSPQGFVISEIPLQGVGLVSVIVILLSSIAFVRWRRRRGISALSQMTRMSVEC